MKPVPRPPHAGAKRSTFQPAPFAPPPPPPPMRTVGPTCAQCGQGIVWIQMEKTGKSMPCDRVQRYGDGRRHLVVRHEYDAGVVLGQLIVRASADVLGFEPHWGTCPKRDRAKSDELPGRLASCEYCGIQVRYLTLEPKKGQEQGDEIAVAPFPLQGNWCRPPAPFEHGAELVTLPLSKRRARSSGWAQGARLFPNPPSTVEGFRPHALDCPARGEHS